MLWPPLTTAGAQSTAIQSAAEAILCDSDKHNEYEGVLIVLRGSCVSIVLVALMASVSFQALAQTSTTPSPSEPYAVLQRLGLLDRPPAPPASSPSTAVAPGVAQAANAPLVSRPLEPVLESARAAPVSEAASAAELPSALSRAYDMLRAKGLLPGIPGAPPIRSTTAHKGATLQSVLVDKSDRKLYLLRDGKIYRQYAISLGAMPRGAKQRVGDLKTPEGNYTLDWRNPNSRFYKSIHISYPNEQDRLQAAQKGVDPGGDIMIHGEHYLPALKRVFRRARNNRDWTEGCIALNNEYIDEIWREVADGTPIEIRP